MIFFFPVFVGSFRACLSVRASRAELCPLIHTDASASTNPQAFVRTSWNTRCTPSTSVLHQVFKHSNSTGLRFLSRNTSCDVHVPDHGDRRPSRTGPRASGAVSFRSFFQQLSYLDRLYRGSTPSRLNKLFLGSDGTAGRSLEPQLAVTMKGGMRA